MAIETNPIEQIYATKEHPYVSSKTSTLITWLSLSLSLQLL